MGRVELEVLIDWAFLNFLKPSKSKGMTSWKLIPRFVLRLCALPFLSCGLACRSAMFESIPRRNDARIDGATVANLINFRIVPERQDVMSSVDSICV